MTNQGPEKKARQEDLGQGVPIKTQVGVPIEVG